MLNLGGFLSPRPWHYVAWGFLLIFFVSSSTQADLSPEDMKAFIGNIKPDRPKNSKKKNKNVTTSPTPDGNLIQKKSCKDFADQAADSLLRWEPLPTSSKLSSAQWIFDEAQVLAERCKDSTDYAGVQQLIFIWYADAFAKQGDYNKAIDVYEMVEKNCKYYMTKFPQELESFLRFLNKATDKKNNVLKIIKGN